MRIWFLLFVALNVYSVVVYARAISEEEDDEYYWREYKGKIPKDALPGGANSNGITTFIGQVLHENQLIPAKIDPELNKVYYEWGYKEYEATQNVKILCTKHPEAFEWLNTGNGLLHNVEDKPLVSGGFEAGAKLYVGRKQLEDELAIGKIISTKIQTTLNTTKDGKGYQHATFQILSYNPTKKRRNEDGLPTYIDVRMGNVDIHRKNVTINVFLS